MWGKGAERESPMGTKSRNLDSIIKAPSSAGCSLCFPPFNFFLSVSLSLTPPPLCQPTSFSNSNYSSLSLLLHTLPHFQFPLYHKHTQESPPGPSALTTNTLTHTVTYIMCHVPCILSGKSIHLSLCSFSLFRHHQSGSRVHLVCVW